MTLKPQLKLLSRTGVLYGSVKMSKNRLEALSLCMVESSRFFEHIQGRRYFNCDICWTCESFDFQTNECTLTYDEAKKRSGNKKVLLKTLGPSYFGRVEIKKPLWYRCSVWKDGNI